MLSSITPATGYLPVDHVRDEQQALAANDPMGLGRKFEKLPEQRARDFDSYPLAVEHDAIEAGILPLTNAIFTCGGYPQFSCQGHPRKPTGWRHVSTYVCFWVPPENIPFWDQAILTFEQPTVLKASTRVEDSKTALLGSVFSGQDGRFITVSFKLHASWDPMTSDPAAEVESLIARAIADCTKRLLTFARLH